MAPKENILHKRANVSTNSNLNSLNPNTSTANKRVSPGVLVIDPNKLYENNQIVDRHVKQEDLTLYCSLKVVKKSEMSITSDGKTGEVSESKSSAIYVNFLNPIKKQNSQDGTFQRKNKFTTDWTDFFTKDSVNDTTNGDYILDPETFGISEISITINASLMPKITIKFIDVQGRVLFERGNQSDNPYNLFFTYPYPKFYLTIKGYFGKAIEIPLYLIKSDTRFDSSTGNYEVTCELQSEMFAMFNSFLIIYAYAAPFMFLKDNGNYLGQEILNKLYERQNKKIKNNLEKNGKLEDFHLYEIKSNPTLYDLSRAILDIPSSVLNGNNESYDNNNAILRVKSDIDLYDDGIKKFFNNKSNYTVVEEKLNNTNYIVYLPLTSEYKLQQDQPIDLTKGLIEKLNEVITVNLKSINIGTNNSTQTKYSDFINRIKNNEKIRSVTPSYISTITGNESSIINQDLFKFKGGEFYTLESYNILISELIQTVSELQGITDDSYITNEISSLSSNLGYEPNLNNVLRIIANNMQTFLILMQIMSKNALRQLQTDNLRRKKHISFTDYATSTNNVDGYFTPFPNYYKQTPDTLPTGEQIERNILAYPGADTQNLNWFEVQFVEEIFKSLDAINRKANPKTQNTFQKVQTGLLTIFGLGEIDMGVYNEKSGITEILSEMLTKFNLYANYSGIYDRGLTENNLKNVTSALASFENELSDKIVFGKINDVQDKTRLARDIVEYVKSGSIKNRKNETTPQTYTNLGNLAINGIDVNGTVNNNVVSIYTGNTVNIKSLMNQEIDMIINNNSFNQENYNELVRKKNKFIDDNIKNKSLYRKINFQDMVNPLFYSVTKDKKSSILGVYPNLTNNLNFYVGPTESYFNNINTAITSIDTNKKDSNPYQGFNRNLNLALSNKKINPDMTTNIVFGLRGVPALTHSTKIDDITNNNNQVFKKVTSPASTYFKLFNNI